MTTICKWLSEKREFSEQYARAREFQAEILVDEIIELADTCRLGTKKTTSAKGVEITEGDMVERSRLMIEARKWTAAKLLPKKYGVKAEFELKKSKIVVKRPERNGD